MGLILNSFNWLIGRATAPILAGVTIVVGTAVGYLGFKTYVTLPAVQSELIMTTESLKVQTELADKRGAVILQMVKDNSMYTRYLHNVNTYTSALSSTANIKERNETDAANGADHPVFTYTTGMQ